MTDFPNKGWAAPSGQPATHEPSPDGLGPSGECQAQGVAAPPPTSRERLRLAMIRFVRARERVNEAKLAVGEAQDRLTIALSEAETAENVVKELLANPASVDTRPKDGDCLQAPLASGAVGEAETPNP